MILKPLIGLALLAAVAIPAGAADAPPGGPVAGPAQAGPQPQPDYHCPTTPYLNCMPPIGEDRRQACSKEYVAWVQAHCPKTQIVY